MNTLELLDKKELLKKRAEEIISGAKKEVRKLNAGEQVEFDTLTKEVADIDIQIRKIEEDNLKQTTHTTNTMKEKFSLLKAINDVANNRQLDERAQEVVGAGIAEMRKAGQSYSGQIVLPIEERADIQATVATAGQENVAEDKLGILEPLRASLVLAQAGASYMTGLVGNVSIPVYSGSNVGWAGEVTAASDGAGTFSEVNLEPKRLTAYIDVSKQFLIQDSNSAEEMLKRDIVSAISNKLEATILGTAAGSATQPAGLLNGVTADTAAVTYTDFVKNINNFNVIYLLTQDVFVTQNQALANSHAKEVDLLVTWLFRLTNEYYDYKMASVIGIIVFSSLRFRGRSLRVCSLPICQSPIIEIVGLSS